MTKSPIKNSDEEIIILTELCKKLDSLGRPDKAERLKELYFIKPEDRQHEEDDNLNLDSAKDFVEFFAMVDTSRGMLLGMDQYGRVSATWDDMINGGHFHIKFFGKSQVNLSVKIDGEYDNLDLSLIICRNKLSELNLI